MRKIRLLYRHALAPADVELGEVFEADEQLANDLVRDGSAEPAEPAEPPDPTKPEEA